MAAAASPPAAPAAPARPYARYAQVLTFFFALGMGAWFVFGPQPGGGRRLVPDKWLNQDGTFYYLTLRTLVDRHTLIQDETQPRSWYEQNVGWNTDLPPDWSNVAVGRDGHYFPKHPILLPLVTIPFYWAFDSYGPLIFNLLCLALLPVIGLRLGLRFVHWIPATLAALVFAASPYLTGQAYGFSNDLFTALLVALAFERAFAGRLDAAGLIWGLSVFAKATDALVLPGLVLIPLLAKDWAGLKRMAIWAAPPIAVYAALNTWMYGAPWHTGYNHILFRQAAQPAFHDVSTDFEWGRYGTRLMDLLWHPGQFGMHDRALFWLIGLPGAMVGLVRAPRVAGPLVLGAVAPVLMLAPFRWFRVEFLDGTVTLSVAFLAALLMFWSRMPVPAPPTAPSRVRWSRLGPAFAVIVLLIGGGVRAATAPKSDYFDQRLTFARNYLANIPCDYFNWQSQRWECSHYDQGRDDWMTGRTLGALPTFHGHPEHLLSIAPHPSRQPRRLVYEGVPLTGTLTVHYGLRDGTATRGNLQFIVDINGQQHLLPLGAAGELRDQTIDTTAWQGQLGTVTLIAQSDSQSDPPIYFDGGPK